MSFNPQGFRPESTNGCPWEGEADATAYTSLGQTQKTIRVGWLFPLILIALLSLFAYTSFQPPAVEAPPVTVVITAQPERIVETRVVTISIPSHPVVVEVLVTPTYPPKAEDVILPTVVNVTKPVQECPLLGRTYSNPVKFVWTGVLHSRQSYQLVVCKQDDPADCLRSPFIAAETEWTTNIPAKLYGGWTWEVLVVSGSRIIATSGKRMFWFDPFPGEGSIQ